MDKLFYSDSQSGRVVSYNHLFEDLNGASDYCPYCKSSDYYEVFRQILLSMLLGREIILLDADFTEEEVTRLVGDVDIRAVEKAALSEVLSEDNFLRELVAKSDTWRITLFTSGTTGLPKKVSHKYDSIARQVRQGDRHSEDVWGFAYNPTHMAGLQVFLQALLNRNSIVRLFGLDSKEIVKEIQVNGISHISATPTFYRLLLPPVDVCPSVRRITSGGEKFDERTLGQLESLFPNAKFTNVYASTEAGTLFASQGNEFAVRDGMKDRVKVEAGELLIHKSLLGNSDSLRIDGEWYHTGDLVEVVSEDPLTFHFVSRNNEMINVGGYKVNPNEVEDCLRECDGVVDAKVYGKANRIMGNIVLCDVIRKDSTVSEKVILDTLRQKLQEFKIPRMIRFVDHLDVTRTGKISRQ